MKVGVNVSLYIKKFGGSSVATPEKMIGVAKRVIYEKKENDRIVIVVSAMGNTTDELIKLAGKVTKEKHGREMDVLLATGEQVAISMLAMTFMNLGVSAVSLTGEQAGIFVKGDYGKSFISEINPKRVFNELENGNIVIVAGFQGINSNGNVATLGRGGSDATAVALAGAMHADICEIFTDVEGVYSADPRYVHNAVKMKEITNAEMLEMARLGAEVMQPRSVEIGLQYHIPIHVRSTFSQNEGTVIKETCKTKNNKYVVKGVTHDINVSKVLITGFKNEENIIDIIKNELIKNNISADMFIRDNKNIIFTIKHTDLEDAKIILASLKSEKLFDSIAYESNIAKVSVVGMDMLDSENVLSRVIKALDDVDIAVDIAFKTDISISFIILEKNVKDAVQRVHSEFFNNL